MVGSTPISPLVSESSDQEKGETFLVKNLNYDVKFDLGANVKFDIVSLRTSGSRLYFTYDHITLP